MQRERHAANQQENGQPNQNARPTAAAPLLSVLRSRIRPGIARHRGLMFVVPLYAHRLPYIVNDSVAQTGAHKHPGSN
jgi:hypothetical protein